MPSYLGFKDRANNAAAGANVRAALPSVEAYYADNGTYAGITLANLRLIDSGIKVTDPAVTPGAAAQGSNFTAFRAPWAVSRGIRSCLTRRLRPPT